MLALFELDPLRSPNLLAAAFGERETRFRFEYDAIEAEEATRARVSEGAGFLPLSDDRIGKELQVWIALASTAIGTVRTRMTAKVCVSHIPGAFIPSDREARIEQYFASLEEAVL